jgi:hypothetical protein
MKTLNLIFIINILPSLVAAQSFEGIIRMEATNNEAGEDARITWYIGTVGQRLDYEVRTKEGNGTYSLFFPKNDVNAYMTAEGNGEKRLYTIPPTLADPSNPMNQLFFARETGKRTPLGPFDAREVMIQGTKGYVQCWVAEVPGLSVNDFPKMLQGRGAINALIAQGIAGIPVDLKAFDLEGKVLFSQKIISVEPGRVETGILRLPDGYTRIN